MDVWCEEGNCMVECFGELTEDSNFEVCCDDEDFDGVWCDANPDGGTFQNWQEVVNTLWKYYDSPIVQVCAI